MHRNGSTYITLTSFLPFLRGWLNFLEMKIVRHNWFVFVTAVFVGSFFDDLLFSQTPTPIAQTAPINSAGTSSSGSTTDAIVKEVAASVIAFNKGDAKSFAAFWTPEGEYIDPSGQSFVGRGSIESHFAEVFAASPNAKLQLFTDSVRLLSDSTAIEDGRSIVESSPNSPAELSAYTAVYVKLDGKWLLASVRETWMNNSLNSEVLTDLEWLIGEWIAEENGVRTESKCRWIVNNKFVERAYTTTQIDGSVSSGVQIIGWNPQANHVQSWNFTEDGGHAVGVWSATEGGWLAKVTGTTGANVSTTAVNLLRRLDDNAYAWQSINRTVGDVRLPDTDEVIIRRKAGKK